MLALSPDLVDRLARAAVGIAQDAELDLIGRIAKSLSRGIDAPSWAVRQLGEVGRLRMGWERVTDAYLVQLRTAVGSAVMDAGSAGEQAALLSLIHI